MNRLFFVKLHLFFSGLALVFTAFMSLSGAYHLLVGGEPEAFQEIKRWQVSTKMSPQEMSDTLLRELKAHDPSYQFEQIKQDERGAFTRPTTRDYYFLQQSQSELILLKRSPSILKAMIEFHQGHGSQRARPIQGLLGVFVFLAVVSGLWLGLSSPVLRKNTVITVISGTLLLMGLFLI